MHKIWADFCVQEGHGAQMKLCSGSLDRARRVMLLSRYPCWRAATTLLWFFNFSGMSFLILLLLKCLVWNSSCQEDTYPSQSTPLPSVHRQEKAQAPVINQKHWLLAVKILNCLDFTLLCQYSPVYEWEKNGRKQLERCQWVGVHDLWRHFHPSYFVLQALNRLLASAHQWRLLNNSGLECLSPVSLT